MMLAPLLCGVQVAAGLVGVRLGGLDRALQEGGRRSGLRLLFGVLKHDYLNFEFKC